MTDIDELFSRDPLQYSEQDLDRIIAQYRKMREQFMLNPKTKAAKVEPAAKAPANISLDDLNL